MKRPNPHVRQQVSRIRVPVRPAANGGYEVMVGAGLLGRLHELLPARCPAHRYAIISDSQVAPLYATAIVQALQAEEILADLFTFPAGEASKTRESWARITDEMLGQGFGRDSAVVAVGGGVVGDLGGFVAATYMRGIPFVQVPTSLLAMIDASVGGKTGVDAPTGKNLVGAMHQPEMVITDVEALRTLSRAHFTSGLAEAVKHGAIADASYFTWMEGAAEPLLEGNQGARAKLIHDSIAIKADIVARDETEKGPRKALNFGHTIGHALETLSSYRLLHGEAIAVGMVLEARLGEQSGVTEAGTADRLERLLKVLGLPVRIPHEFKADQILESTRSDKKSRGGKVEYALLSSIGSAVWNQAIQDEEVKRVIDLHG